jgi:hypothetical protein
MVIANERYDYVEKRSQNTHLFSDFERVVYHVSHSTLPLFIHQK